MQNKLGFLNETVELFESSPRAREHNQYGSHIYTPELDDMFGAKKGRPFIGADGRTYYTAFYDDPDTGRKASDYINEKLWNRTQGDTLEFSSRYTGLPKDNPTVVNYSNEIKRRKKLQDLEAAKERFANYVNLQERKEELYTEFPSLESKIDKLIETGKYSVDGIRDIVSKVKLPDDFDYDTFKNDMKTYFDYTEDEEEGFKNAFLRGYGNLKQMVNVLGYQLGVDPEERIKQIAIEQANLDELESSEGLQRFQNPNNDFKTIAEELKANPVSIISQLTAESLTQFLPVGFALGIPVYAATAAASLPLAVGTATAAGLASLGIEYTGEILNSFRQQGVDVKNPDELAAAFADEDVNAKARTEAIEKGVPVALFDGISGGVAGRFFKQARGLGLTRRLTAVGKEIVTQAGLGATGEAVGQFVALDVEEGEQYNLPAIVAEGVVEIATGGVAGTVNILFDNGNKIENVPDDDPFVQDVADAMLENEQAPRNEKEALFSSRVSSMKNKNLQPSIGFAGEIVQPFTEKEIESKNYSPSLFSDSEIQKGDPDYIDDGVTRYRLPVQGQNFDYKDGRRIVLSEDATQADFVEEVVESAKVQMANEDPQLDNDIDAWVRSKEIEAIENSIELPYKDIELYSKAVLDRLGYDVGLPEGFNLPEELFEATKDKLETEDGGNVLDGMEVNTESTATPEPELTFNFKVGDIIKSTDGSNISLIVTDVSDNKFVRGVSTQTGDGKVISFYKNKNWKLEDENTLSEFQKENVKKYKPEPEPEVKEQPEIATERKATPEAKTITVDPRTIEIDEERFQPREEYSQATVDSIAENFDPLTFEPPLVWKDPADGKFYIVGGHHRQLGVLKGGYESINYKVIEGSLEDAIGYSEETNTNRKEQTVFENAAIIRRRRDAGQTFPEIAAKLTGLEQSFLPTLHALSFLDPKGLFKENYENTSGFRRIKTKAQDIGRKRKRYDWMTDRHEDDIFTYLYKENAVEQDYQKVEVNIDKTLEKVDAMNEKPSTILNQLRKNIVELPEDADAETQNKAEDFDARIRSLQAQLDDTGTIAEQAEKLAANDKDLKATDAAKQIEEDLIEKKKKVLKEKADFIDSLTEEDPNQSVLFSLSPDQVKEYSKYYDKKVTRQERKNARNSEKQYRTKQKRDYFRSLSSRLDQIHPKLKESLRRYQKAEADILTSYLTAAEPFAKSLQRLQKKARSKKARANYVALKLALFNGDVAGIESALGNRRLIKQYRTWKAAHQNLHDQAMAVGVDMGFIENHFPREVSNYDAFLQYVSGITSSGKVSKISQAFQDAQAKQGGVPLTNEQKVSIANLLLRQSKNLMTKKTTDWTKSRKIDELTPELLKFYSEPHIGLARYGSGLAKQIAIAKYLGGRPNRYAVRKFPKAEKIKGYGLYDFRANTFLRYDNFDLIVFPKFNDPKALSMMEILREEEQRKTGVPYKGIQDQIGEMVLQIESRFGMLSKGQSQRLTQLLSDYFNENSMNPFVSGMRSIGYISSMGSFFSAITQLGDLGAAIYRSGQGRFAGFVRPSTYTRVLSEFIKSFTKLNKIKLKDLGLEDKVLQELSENRSTLQNALNLVFKASGIKLVDRIGKETYVNTVMGRYTKAAKQLVKGRKNKLTRDLQRRVSNKFNSLETAKVIRDLANGKKSDLVELLAYSELLDVQPVAKSEVPVGYLRHPNGRIMYMLKTYFLKRFDIFQKETQLLKQQGKRNAAYINIVMLGMVLAMAEASADKIKDMMAGRPTELDEYVYSNLLKLVGVSRYHYYNFINSKPSQAILKMLVPPFDYLDDPWQDLKFLVGRLDKYKNTRTPAKYALDDFKKRGARWIRHIPVAGKHLYWIDESNSWKKTIDEYAPFMSPGYGKRVLKERREKERNK